MSMSTSVIGFRPPDAEWKKMKAVWDSCKKAHIEIPNKVRDFFNDEEPDEAGVSVRLEKTAAVREWHSDYGNGFEVILDKVPDGVKTIRFFNSW